MNGLELTTTDILEIIGFLGLGVGGWIKIRIDAALSKQKLDQMDKDLQYMRESLQGVKGMVHKQNDELTKALHENSTAIRELKITLEYIREDK